VPAQDPLPGLVQRWTDGDRNAFGEIVELLYDDLRAMAHRQLRSERSDHTLTTTALVHETFVELSNRAGPAWRGRAQFFALLSRVMRHVLIDYARGRNAARRGGGNIRVALDDSSSAADAEVFELLAVSQAIDQLEAQDERLARLVECKFFGGMSEAEIAEALGVSVRTIERDWKRARAYLFTFLAPDATASGS
jgi:RNA polymerase sigma factor (TIGR02999 family)